MLRVRVPRIAPASGSPVINVSARSFEGGAPRGARSIIVTRSASASEVPRSTTTRQLRATRAAASGEATHARAGRSLILGRAAAAGESPSATVQRLLQLLRQARSSEAPHARSNALSLSPQTDTKGRIVRITATATTRATLAAHAAPNTLRDRAATVEVSDE